MDEKNENTTGTIVIHLFQFHAPQIIIVLFFCLLLTIYYVTISGNLLIIILVIYSKSLHSPMYFFLIQLSVSDIVLITDIVPNMLHSVLSKEAIISLSCCMTQFFFLALPGCLECFILTVMSFDRYLAICKPLHYVSVMNHRCCLIMIAICWSVSILMTLIVTSTILKLHFCGPDIIDHFFCDLGPILKLSCSDTTVVQIQTTLLSTSFIVIPFFIIITSYVYIIVTIFNIPSISGRQKVFSTCSSHLSVVAMYYGTLIGVYLFPRTGQSLNIYKFVSLLYTAVTPLLNPIVYSLRNKDLKKAVAMFITKLKSLPFIYNKIYS